MHLLNPVYAVLMLTLDGSPFLQRCYNEKIEMKRLEKELYKKTRSVKKKNEILTSGGYFIIHRCVSDLHIYIIGDRNSCAMLDRILYCLVETVSTITTRNAHHKSVHGSLDQIIKAYDEIFSQSMILEADPEKVLERVYQEVDVAEQSIEQVLQSASEYLKFSWFKS